MNFRAATASLWQARPQQWQPHQRCAAAAIYSEKSRQGLGLGGLASRSGPEFKGKNLYLVNSPNSSSKSEVTLKYGFFLKRRCFFKNEFLISCPFLSTKLDSPVIKTLERHFFSHWVCVSPMLWFHENLIWMKEMGNWSEVHS